MSYERSSMKVIFIAAIAVAVAVLLGITLSGCATARTYGPMVVRAVFDLSTNVVETASAKTNVTDTASTPEASVDDVPFNSLVWESGGFSPASTTVVKGNISAVSFDGRTITYSATVDADWGKEAAQPPNATVCAVFFLGSDGVWRGGKFDWIGNLGRPRPAQHIASYSGWKHAYPAPKGEEFCFVLIRGDNRKYRTRVIKGRVK